MKELFLKVNDNLIRRSTIWIPHTSFDQVEYSANKIAYKVLIKYLLIKIIRGIFF